MSTLQDGLKSAGKTTWRWIRIGLLVVLLIWVCYFLFIYFANFSEGTRTGFVTKISKRGYVFKTHEGELNTGFFTSPTATGKPADNVWYFSVSNKIVANEIQLASETGNKVTLFYKQKYRKIFFLGDTDYLVYKIDLAPNSSNQNTPTQ
ncbi:MAG: hypothetical protein M3Q56_04155 [Bacteroidota bacterium]|nr:hypothetical protein [Bacteroidota bacterium]